MRSGTSLQRGAELAQRGAEVLITGRHEETLRTPPRKAIFSGQTATAVPLRRVPIPGATVHFDTASVHVILNLKLGGVPDTQLLIIDPQKAARDAEVERRVKDALSHLEERATERANQILLTELATSRSRHEGGSAELGGQAGAGAPGPGGCVLGQDRAAIERQGAAAQARGLRIVAGRAALLRLPEELGDGPRVDEDVRRREADEPVLPLDQRRVAQHRPQAVEGD